MNYLDMILAEAATPVKEKNTRSESSQSAAKNAKRAAKAAAKGSSSELSIHYKKTTAVQKLEQKIAKEERMLASGTDENGNQLNPDKVKAIKAQLAADKKALATLKSASSGKRRSTSFDFSSKKDSRSSRGSKSVGAGASGSASGSSTAEKIYLEGYFTALDEMGYFDEDEDYDYDEYDEYDEDDTTEAYLEGYYSAFLDNGYDIDEL